MICDGCEGSRRTQWSPAWRLWLCHDCRERRTDQELATTSIANMRQAQERADKARSKARELAAARTAAVERGRWPRTYGRPR